MIEIRLFGKANACSSKVKKRITRKILLSHKRSLRSHSSSCKREEVMTRINKKLTNKQYWKSLRRSTRAKLKRWLKHIKLLTRSLSQRLKDRIKSCKEPMNNWPFTLKTSTVITRHLKRRLPHLWTMKEDSHKKWMILLLKKTENLLSFKVNKRKIEKSTNKSYLTLTERLKRLIIREHFRYLNLKRRELSGKWKLITLRLRKVKLMSTQKL